MNLACVSTGKPLADLAGASAAVLAAPMSRKRRNVPRKVRPMSIVATAVSRHGGTCPGCDERIAAGEMIFKVDTGDRGGQTSYGNGLGAWVCAGCATEADRPS